MHICACPENMPENMSVHMPAHMPFTFRACLHTMSATHFCCSHMPMCVMPESMLRRMRGCYAHVHANIDSAYQVAASNMRARVIHLSGETRRSGLYFFPSPGAQGCCRPTLVPNPSPRLDYLGWHELFRAARSKVVDPISYVGMFSKYFYSWHVVG